MRHAFFRVGLASLSVIAFAAALASPSQARDHDCDQRALVALHASAPDGWSVYKTVSDKKFFMGWLDCEDPQFELSTAVHESVHSITGDKDAFPLIDGGAVERPHEVSNFFPPSTVAGKFGTSDYVDTYLKPGRATSSKDFLYLLDELNAYSHDLNAAVDLKEMRSASRSSDHRDGLAALMAFMAVYVERAKTSEPETWEGLRKPEVSAKIEKLWGQAEKVMASSCGIPDFGTQYVGFLQKVCKPEAQSALASVIGRQPVCPTACLKPMDDQAEALAPADVNPSFVENTPGNAPGIEKEPAFEDAPPAVEKRTIRKYRHHRRPAPTLDASAEAYTPSAPVASFPHTGR